MAKTLKTGWLPRVIDGAKTKVYAWSHAKCCYYGDPDDGVTVEDELKSLNSNLIAADNLHFKFATDGEGNYGYKDLDGNFKSFGNVQRAYETYSSSAVLGNWQTSTTVISTLSKGYVQGMAYNTVGAQSYSEITIEINGSIISTGSYDGMKRIASLPKTEVNDGDVLSINIFNKYTTSQSSNPITFQWTFTNTYD